MRYEVGIMALEKKNQKKTPERTAKQYGFLHLYTKTKKNPPSPISQNWYTFIQ